MPWIVFAAAFAVYAWTAAPATTWLDAPEFASAAASLGIAHPPGHPIPSLLGRLVAYLPAGDLAFRVNLASALAAAIAAAAVAQASAAVVRRLAPASPAGLTGAAVGLGFALARAAWEQAVRAEVYALEAALVLAALAWLVACGRRNLYAAAFALGLAAANHHFITLVFLVPAAAALILGRAGLGAIGRAAAFGVLGLGAFLYLPLRAARDVLGWGDPDHLGAFVWTVSARAFQKALGQALPPFSERAADVATALAGDATLPLVALALLGAYALVRARAGATLLLLGGVVLLGAAARAALGFDADNPDARGYLLPAFGALFVLGAAGLAMIAQAAPRVAGVVAAAALVLPAFQLARNTSDQSLRGARAAEAYGHAVLARVPPGALLLTSYFETTFQVRSLQILLGERPDLAIIDRKLFKHPYAPAAARRLHPDLAAFIDRGLSGPLDRPLRFELAPDLDGDPADFVLLDDLAPRLATSSVSDRHGADKILAWTDYLTVRFHCHSHRRAAAQAAFDRARGRATPPAVEDEMFAALARDCDLH